MLIFLSCQVTVGFRTWGVDGDEVLLTAYEEVDGVFQVNLIYQLIEMVGTFF